MVFSTHDVAEVERYATRVLLLADGELLFTGTPAELEWSRVGLWGLSLAFGGLAFGALGVMIGGAAREVSAASLLAFLISLPVAFVALVPATAVSGGCAPRWT